MPPHDPNQRATSTKIRSMHAAYARVNTHTCRHQRNRPEPDHLKEIQNDFLQPVDLQRGLGLRTRAAEHSHPRAAFLRHLRVCARELRECVRAHVCVCVCVCVCVRARARRVLARKQASITWMQRVRAGARGRASMCIPSHVRTVTYAHTTHMHARTHTHTHAHTHTHIPGYTGE